MWECDQWSAAPVNVKSNSTVWLRDYLASKVNEAFSAECYYTRKLHLFRLKNIRSIQRPWPYWSSTVIGGRSHLWFQFNLFSPPEERRYIIRSLVMVGTSNYSISKNFILPTIFPWIVFKLHKNTQAFISGVMMTKVDKALNLIFLLAPKVKAFVVVDMLSQVLWFIQHQKHKCHTNGWGWRFSNQQLIGG